MTEFGIINFDSAARLLLCCFDCSIQASYSGGDWWVHSFRSSPECAAGIAQNVAY